MWIPIGIFIWALGVTLILRVFCVLKAKERRMLTEIERDRVKQGLPVIQPRDLYMRGLANDVQKKLILTQIAIRRYAIEQKDFSTVRKSEASLIRLFKGQ